MPRACTICIHPDRDAIDAALARGASHRDVAKRFAASAPALFRHQQTHLPERLLQAKQAEVVGGATTLLDKIAGYEATAHRLLKAAESEKDYRTALAAVRELTRIVELLARMQGEMPDGQTVNVLVASPEWATTQRAVLAALQPYPEAKQAVLSALRPLAVAA